MIIGGNAAAFLVLTLLLTIVSGAASIAALIAALLPSARQHWAGFYYVTALGSVLPPVSVAAMCMCFGGNAGGLAWLVLCLPLILSLAALCVYSTKALRKTNVPKQEMDPYEGPRCVACAKPIEYGVSRCPKCGWTQPA